MNIIIATVITAWILGMALIVAGDVRRSRRATQIGEGLVLAASAVGGVLGLVAVWVVLLTA